MGNLVFPKSRITSMPAAAEVEGWTLTAVDVEGWTLAANDYEGWTSDAAEVEGWKLAATWTSAVVSGTAVEGWISAAVYCISIEVWTITSVDVEGGIRIIINFAWFLFAKWINNK